jgi:hypothetical protein
MQARGSGSGSSLAGQVFEQLVHEKFGSGKAEEFPIRRLLPSGQKQAQSINKFQIVTLC